MTKSQAPKTSEITTSELRTGDTVNVFGALVELGARTTYVNEYNRMTVYRFDGAVVDWSGREQGERCPLGTFARNVGDEWTIQGTDLRAWTRVSA